MKTKPLRLKELVNNKKKYLLHLSANTMSLNSIKAYTCDINQLLRLMAIILKEDESIQIKHFQSCIYAISKKIKKNTLARKICVWKRYVSYISELKKTKNIIKDLRAPKVIHNTEIAIPADILEKFMDFNLETREVLLLRNTAIMELLYGSGIHLVELQKMNTYDVMFESKMIVIRSRPYESRYIPCTQKALLKIKAYLSLRKAISNEYALFVSQRKTRLSINQMQTIIKKRNKEFGFFRKINASTLRQNYTKYLLKSSGDILGVRVLLNHTSVLTTYNYTEFENLDVIKQYQDFHPRAKKIDKSRG